MRNAIAAALLFATISASLTAQDKPRALHVQGPQAFQLISLLVSGSNAIQVSFMNNHATRIHLGALDVMKFATQKYDSDASMYRLDVYSARAQIGDATDASPIGEASALYKLLASIGVTPDGSMQGTDVEADTVDCRIDTTLSSKNPKRFVCDLALSF